MLIISIGQLTMNKTRPTQGCFIVGVRVGFVGRLLVNIAGYLHKPTPTDTNIMPRRKNEIALPPNPTNKTSTAYFAVQARYLIR